MSNQPENDLFNLDNLFAPAWRNSRRRPIATQNTRGAMKLPRPRRSPGWWTPGGGGFGGQRRDGGARPRAVPAAPVQPAVVVKGVLVLRSASRCPGGPAVIAVAVAGLASPAHAMTTVVRVAMSAPHRSPCRGKSRAGARFRGVDMLARQIKMTGRAYPLFQIALMILEKPERHAVTFTVKKNAEANRSTVVRCALDESLWLSENEVIQHILSTHLATFYQPSAPRPSRQGQIHVRRAVRHERHHSRPAESS